MIFSQNFYFKLPKMHNETKAELSNYVEFFFKMKIKSWILKKRLHSCLIFPKKMIGISDFTYTLNNA